VRCGGAKSEDLAFLVALRTSPQDEALRLVYADWLEERGDPRADYLRITTEALGRIRRGLSWDELKPSLRAACEAAPAERRDQVEPWFDVVLESFQPEQKIPLVHLVRAIATDGLKEAKDLVEAAPAVIKRHLLPEQGEAIRAGLASGHLPDDREAQTHEHPYYRVVLRESPPDGEPVAPPGRPRD
jgi:uncharacterized protein (TIGR02996 family)